MHISSRKNKAHGMLQVLFFTCRAPAHVRKEAAFSLDMPCVMARQCRALICGTAVAFFTCEALAHELTVGEIGKLCPASTCRVS